MVSIEGPLQRDFPGSFHVESVTTKTRLEDDQGEILAPRNADQSLVVCSDLREKKKRALQVDGVRGIHRLLTFFEEKKKQT